MWKTRSLLTDRHSIPGLLVTLTGLPQPGARGSCAVDYAMKKGTSRHFKTKRLAKALDVHRQRATGILVDLWEFAGEYATDGTIGKLTDDEIAEAVDWTEEPVELVNALVSTGWLDACETDRLVIHDWLENCDEWVKKRLCRVRKSNVSRQRLDGVETTSRQRQTCKEGEGKDRGGKEGKGKGGSKGGTATLRHKQAVAIYQRYPRKQHRAAAIASIKKLLTSGVAADHLSARTTAYASSPAGQPPIAGATDYRPYPASWFTAQGYDDDSTHWQQPNGSGQVQTEGQQSIAAIQAWAKKKAQEQEVSHDTG